MVLPSILNRVWICYISSILFKFHWDFNKRHYFYDKRTCIDFFKSSPTARLYLEVSVKMARLNLKTVCIDSLLCYIPFASSLAVCILFSYRKKRFKYMESWYIGTFCLIFCCTILPKWLTIIFMNRVISIIHICRLYFMLFLM